MSMGNCNVIMSDNTKAKVESLFRDFFLDEVDVSSIDCHSHFFGSSVDLTFATRSHRIRIHSGGYAGDAEAYIMDFIEAFRLPANFVKVSDKHLNSMNSFFEFPYKRRLAEIRFDRV